MPETNGEIYNFQEAVEPEFSGERYFSLEYHGKELGVLEMDHMPFTTTAEKAVERPKEWRQILRDRIKNFSGVIAPEYCTPELAIHRAYSEMVTGPIAENKERIWSSFDDPTINEFYDWIACCAGAEGKSLIAVDPADTSLYTVYETLSVIKFNVMKKMGIIPKEMSYLGKCGEIDPVELVLSTSQDARHLLTARGMMEYALSSGENVLNINAPVHAERIVNYVKRQRDFEKTVSEGVKVPKDLVKLAPKEEANKMRVYAKGGLERNIREYAPVLPSEAYALDMEIQKIMYGADLDAVIMSENKDDVDNLVKIIDGFTEKYSESNDSFLTEYLVQLGELRGGLKKVNEMFTGTYEKMDEERKEAFRWISGIMNKASTRRYWLLKSKNYIY